jgi:hypothetical protein
MAVKSAGFENKTMAAESRFVDVSDEFLNELLDNSIPKIRSKTRSLTISRRQLELVV